MSHYQLSSVLYMVFFPHEEKYIFIWQKVFVEKIFETNSNKIKKVNRVINFWNLIPLTKKKLFFVFSK